METNASRGPDRLLRWGQTAASQTSLTAAKHDVPDGRIIFSRTSFERDWVSQLTDLMAKDFNEDQGSPAKRSPVNSTRHMHPEDAFRGAGKWKGAVPGVPGPSLVYLVASLPKPERLGLARPSVCAPLSATSSMSPSPMR